MLPDAIALVHEQGGICGPSHPLDPRRHGIGAKNLLTYYSQFDFIEIFNARMRDHTKNDEAASVGRAAGCARYRLQRCAYPAGSRDQPDPLPTRCPQPRDFLRELKTVERVPFYTSPITSASSLFASLVHKTGLLERAKSGRKPAHPTNLR